MLKVERLESQRKRKLGLSVLEVCPITLIEQFENCQKQKGASSR